jgi:putative FmdB family regulatory protein
MPIFEYVCRECNHRFELLVQGTATAACPQQQLTSNFPHSASGRREAGRPHREEVPVGAAVILGGRAPAP